MNVKIKGRWLEPDLQQQIDLIKISWKRNGAQVHYYEWPRSQTDQTISMDVVSGDVVKFDIWAWASQYGDGPVTSSPDLIILPSVPTPDPNAPGPIEIIGIEIVP